jgi:hypothetical protein
LLAYEAQVQDVAWKFYNVVALCQDGASLKVRIWERQVHNLFHARTLPLEGCTGRKYVMLFFLFDSCFASSTFSILILILDQFG